MPKVFYTDIDIQDMVKSGVLSLEVNDNVVLTDLAYEQARRLGLKLVHRTPENPPAAPMRPYIAQKAAQALSPSGQALSPSGQAAAPGGQSPVQAPGVPAPATGDQAELSQRIRSAVTAKLGSQVDAALLDAIIRRVLESTGVR